MKPTVKIGNNPNTSAVYAATALNMDRHITSSDKDYDKVPSLTYTDPKTHD